MATPIKLAAGLGGAIGSDYVQSQNRLYFVEFNGKVSVLDLVRPLDTTVFTGAGTTMPADTSLSLFDGTSAQGGQIRWDHTSPDGKLVMRPQGTCQLSYLGATNYDAITYTEVQNLSYSQASLRGEGVSNQLAVGAVFAVFNWDPSPVDNFDYAKVQVLQNAGGSIKVRWVAWRLKPRYRVIGTGYNQPEDIKVTAAGGYAYVTERTGALLRVNLSNANRAAAQTVATGMTAPHQIALDEAHGRAYVPEFVGGGAGKLWRVDLSSGVKTAVYAGLDGCTGLLMSSDLAFAYVAEQTAGGGRVARINLATAQRTVLATGLTAPFFMEWADSAQSRIILPERDPSNRVVMLDITTTPATRTDLLTGVPARPSSVVQHKPGKLLVCSDAEINLYDIASSFFSLAGPLFMGIGLVPVDHIINTGSNATDGYADTTDNPGYILQVKDAPFGGGLSIMINHNAALLAGALYYKLFVQQVTPAAGAAFEPRQAFSDYLWNAGSSSFVPTPTNPDASGFYPVRVPWQIWYNTNLGYVLDTSIMANGLWVIDIKLYNSAHVEIPVASIHSRRVRVDNQWPVANIEKIFHPGPPTEVAVCAIVNSGTDEFSFQITATDPQGHMLSWGLTALWGDNKSATVAGDSYSPGHVSPTRQWAGITSGVVPSPAWHAKDPGGVPDPTSTRCAHTFYLSVWDRVINGYGYLHNQTYHKSITIWL